MIESPRNQHTRIQHTIPNACRTRMRDVSGLVVLVIGQKLVGRGDQGYLGDVKLRKLEHILSGLGENSTGVIQVDMIALADLAGRS